MCQYVDLFEKGRTEFDVLIIYTITLRRNGWYNKITVSLIL